MEININGCRIHYERLGIADDHTKRILILHGWGCNGAMFAPISTELSKDADVTVIDFPGHGQSDEPPEPWGVPQYAEMTKALITQLGIAPVEIIAHSFGGRIAIYLASQYPQLVDKLVITGGAGIRRPVSEKQRKTTQRFKRYNAALNSLKKLGIFKPAIEKMQTKLRNRYGSPDYNRLDEVMRKSFVQIINLDLLPMLKNIKASTLLIWGSNDTETPLWMGQEMEKAIPDAGLVLFGGGSHFAFLEQWQRFYLICKAFILEGQPDGE